MCRHCPRARANRTERAFRARLSPLRFQFLGHAHQRPFVVHAPQAAHVQLDVRLVFRHRRLQHWNENETEIIKKKIIKKTKHELRQKNITAVAARIGCRRDGWFLGGFLGGGGGVRRSVSESTGSQNGS